MIFFSKSFDFWIFGVGNRPARGTLRIITRILPIIHAEKIPATPPPDDITIIERQRNPHSTSTIVDYYTKQEKFGPVPLRFKSEIRGKGPKHESWDESLKEPDNPVFFRTWFN